MSDDQQSTKDVLFHIDTLRMMSPNGEMPKRWHDGFWRVMDEARAEIVRLRDENRALLTGSGGEE